MIQGYKFHRFSRNIYLLCSIVTETEYSPDPENIYIKHHSRIDKVLDKLSSEKKFREKYPRVILHKEHCFPYPSSDTVSKDYAYLLQDVMRNDFSFAYDQEKIWEYCKTKDIKEYNISEVKHWIYRPCWSYFDHKEIFVSIYQVLLQPEDFPKHIVRIKNADISYPLIVITDDFDSKGSILDGNHRFAKILMTKKRKVKYYFLSKQELLKFRIDT